MAEAAQKQREIDLNKYIKESGDFIRVAIDETPTNYKKTNLSWFVGAIESHPHTLQIIDDLIEVYSIVFPNLKSRVWIEDDETDYFIAFTGDSTPVDWFAGEIKN
jgi:hypothetical protein